VDTNDLSACERVLCHPVKLEDLTFSDSGNGFITDKDGQRWSFHKEPYNKSFTLPEIKLDPSELKPVIRRGLPTKTAAEILDSLV